MEHNDVGSFEWFFNDKHRCIGQYTDTNKLPWVWDVGWLSAACGDRLAGAAVGGGVVPQACLHRGPGRDHETGNLAQPRASVSVHRRREWERDCLSHQHVAQSTVEAAWSGHLYGSFNWLSSTRGRTTAGHIHNKLIHWVSGLSGDTLLMHYLDIHKLDQC